MTITITGATGALNGATVEHLLSHRPATDIVVVVRDPATARSFAERGVEVRRADYADRDTLPSAFAGADQLLLVSSSDPSADAVSLHRAVGLDVAAQRLLRAQPQLAAGTWRETGQINVPADGPVSWTAHEDEAEAAAIILASDGGYDGPTTLTATAAPTFRDIAGMASEVSGRQVASASSAKTIGSPLKSPPASRSSWHACSACTTPPETASSPASTHCCDSSSAANPAPSRTCSLADRRIPLRR